MVFVQFLDRGCQFEFLTRGLELLDEVGRTGKQHAMTGIDHGVTEGGGEMRFADARRPEQQNVRSLIEPTVACRQSGDAGFADRGDGGEVETIEGFARG